MRRHKENVAKEREFHAVTSIRLTKLLLRRYATR
jgi:hypothetical protein